MEKLARRSPRFFSDDRGRILSEEERAAENVYIQVSGPCCCLGSLCRSLLGLDRGMCSCGLTGLVLCVENGEGADGEAEATGGEGEARSREGQVRESKQNFGLPFCFICSYRSLVKLISVRFLSYGS